LGLKESNYLIKSKASSEAPWKKLWKVFFFAMLMLCKILAAKFDSMDSISYGYGFPVSSKTLSI
jgi:hypothetical protein